MTDFAITVDGDLDLSANDLALIGGADEIAQEIRVRLQAVQGDWFLDLNEGIPYFSRVLIASPNEADMLAIFRAEIAKVPGVLVIDKDVTLERIDGASLRVVAKVQTTSGAVEVSATVGV